MLLAIDIGNTNTKVAIFKDEEQTEFIIFKKSVELMNFAVEKKITEVAISSVNPSVENTLNHHFKQHNFHLFRAGIDHKLNLRINYETPETLGMDRVCSSVGAVDIALKKKMLSSRQSVITIDFGTATTINIILSGIEFIGGLIAPGINTMLKSLSDNTAQLPWPEFGHYRGVIGNSTNSSIIGGVITSTIGMINEVINKVKTEDSGLNPLIFATGGNSGYILPYLENDIIYDEALVLKGLKVIYELNKDN